MDLLDKVKKALRVSHSALDEAEITPLIDAAKKELEIAGVNMLESDDPMVLRAVTVYVKAHFGYDNPEADRFEKIFNSLKSILSQVGEYTTDEVKPEPPKPDTGTEDGGDDDG